jgi:putative transposase
VPLRLERRYGQHHLHFITFSCYKRLPLLAAPSARDVFVESLGKVRAESGVAIFGYVVMPEHVHLLIDEPPASSPSKVLQELKQRVSNLLRKAAGEHGATAYFWQHRFYDFNIWSRDKQNEKLRYMHLNPVKRGLVSHPKQWPWSSYSFYSRHGTVLLSMDQFP